MDKTEQTAAAHWREMRKQAWMRILRNPAITEFRLEYEDQEDGIVVFVSFRCMIPTPGGAMVMLHESQPLTNERWAKPPKTAIDAAAFGEDILAYVIGRVQAAQKEAASKIVLGRNGVNPRMLKLKP